MKKSLIYGLAITASIFVSTISCTQNSPTTSTSPAVSTTPTTSSTSASPDSARPSPSPTSTASPSAKLSESPTPSASSEPKEKVPNVVRIAIINNSGKVLKAIYMSEPNKRDWSENELDAPLADREKADFEWKRSDYKGADAGCVFDVRAEYDDGKSTELDPIDVCKTPAINLK